MPEAGDLYRTAVHFTMPEQVDAYNVLAWQIVSGICPEAGLMAFLGSALAGVYDCIAALIVEPVDIVDAEVTQVKWYEGKWLVEKLLGKVFPAFAAANLSDMLPHAVSAVLSMLTTKAKCRGRVFVPGLGEDMQEDSLLNQEAATALAVMGGTLLTPFSYEDAVIRYVILRHDGTVAIPSAARVGGIVGSQRKRKPGVGI